MTTGDKRQHVTADYLCDPSLGFKLIFTLPYQGSAQTAKLL